MREHDADVQKEEERGCGAGDPLEGQLGVLDGQHWGEDIEVGDGDVDEVA